MEIKTLKNSGLCYGVKRALQITRETRKQRSGKVFTFGDLIHNPQVIASLETQQIYSTTNLDKLKEGTVIIRSHGVSPDIYEILSQKRIEIIDATCPIVKEIQKLVESLAKKKEEIVIVGNKEHPEIQSLIGFSRNTAKILENEVQAKSLPLKKKRAVLAQSTQDLQVFMEVVAALIGKTKELKIYNTICQFTQTRQKSTSKLASNVDTLFIIGGKNSSNSNKLYQISKRILPNTYFIEKADQITPVMLKGANKIGLSGGASTPHEAVQEAVNQIKASFKHQSFREKTV